MGFINFLMICDVLTLQGCQNLSVGKKCCLESLLADWFGTLFLTMLCLQSSAGSLNWGRGLWNAKKGEFRQVICGNRNARKVMRGSVEFGVRKRRFEFMKAFRCFAGFHRQTSKDFSAEWSSKYDLFLKESLWFGRFRFFRGSLVIRKLCSNHFKEWSVHTQWWSFRAGRCILQSATIAPD